MKEKEKKARTDGCFRSVSEHGIFLFQSNSTTQKGQTSLISLGRSQREGWWDAGLEIPSDCLKQPSSTLVGWFDFEWKNGSLFNQPMAFMLWGRMRHKRACKQSL